jgi:cytochrome c biogenesis protein CcmG/thiol:disulfide interchange protein DsbE
MPWRVFSRLLLQIAAVGVLLTLIGLLTWRVVEQDNAERLVDEVRAGDTPAAPELRLPELDGDGEVSLASLRGKAVVLNFWASWCEPCKEEAPMLQRSWEENRDRGVVVLGVNAQDLRKDARRFAERYGLTYPLVHDGPGKSLGRYGLVAFPETWWIDREGRLVAYAQGEFSQEELEENIERALGKPS